MTGPISDLLMVTRCAQTGVGTVFQTYRDDLFHLRIRGYIVIFGIKEITALKKKAETSLFFLIIILEQTG